MRHNPIRAGLVSTLVVFSPIDAQTEECLAQARMGVSKGVWSSILEYIGEQLPFSREETEERAKLTRLRSEIVLLQSEKLNLISILESHINQGDNPLNQSLQSGQVVTNELSLEDIPRILEKIEAITHDMLALADDGNLFAAQDAFRELLISFGGKRSATLCELAVQAGLPEPDLARMSSLLQDLREELVAISAAEEALAQFIRESS